MQFLIYLVVTCTIIESAVLYGVAGADCGVIPMTQWAGEASKRNEVLPNPVNMVIILDTAYEGNFRGDCLDVLQSTRRHQIWGFYKYKDIMQSFLICENGTVYEGAGWNLVGSHTMGYNTESIGIAFMGDFRLNLPTPQALNALRKLLECGVKNNHLNSDYKLVGHRQYMASQSPGDKLQKEIETWPHWHKVNNDYSDEVDPESD